MLSDPLAEQAMGPGNAAHQIVVVVISQHPELPASPEPEPQHRAGRASHAWLPAGLKLQPHACRVNLAMDDTRHQSCISHFSELGCEYSSLKLVFGAGAPWEVLAGGSSSSSSSSNSLHGSQLPEGIDCAQACMAAASVVPMPKICSEVSG